MLGWAVSRKCWASSPFHVISVLPRGDHWPSLVSLRKWVLHFAPSKVCLGSPRWGRLLTFLDKTFWVTEPGYCGISFDVSSSYGLFAALEWRDCSRPFCIKWTVIHCSDFTAKSQNQILAVRLKFSIQSRPLKPRSRTVYKKRLFPSIGAFTLPNFRISLNFQISRAS